MSNTIEIYSDWSCIWNPGPWWFATILKFNENSKTIKWSHPNTTNNIMEMTAVIEWLKSLNNKKYPLKIYSDSKYVIDWINNYVTIWEKNWRKLSNKSPVKNKELWIELKTLSDNFKIERIWVKWHSDNILNNLVDKIARNEAKKHLKE